jgi:hypothetical protein
MKLLYSEEYINMEGSFFKTFSGTTGGLLYETKWKESEG